MHEPGDHSQSEFEPGGARRFWGEYARSTRPGASRHGDEPPRGGPGNGSGGTSASTDDHECVEWCPICRTADVVRAGTPPELRDQWQSLQRDALVTLRALLDAYLERLGEQPRRADARVEDIPIE